ncbi:CDP-alcohol phosphatidyltransferase family protein [Ruminococcaceae bacterium OttesenSCG-928-A11]|nr:CDP-alcohol phosphatidyltransferase family protein [Ruminococcaceae bacterium OttesenSCG-928-A11]
MKHIPNILSVTRILLIPLFVWRMMADDYIIAAVILAASGLTDLLDGQLARRFGWVSDVGKVLDPAADKLTQVTVCVVLAIKMPTFWIFFALLLFKDLVMLILGGWLLKKKVHIEGARWFGKVVTTLFYVVMVVLIFFPNIPAWAVWGMLGVVTVLAFAAGLMYVPQFRQYRKEAKSDAAPAEGTQTETQ